MSLVKTSNFSLLLNVKYYDIIKMSRILIFDNRKVGDSCGSSKKLNTNVRSSAPTFFFQ